MAYKELLKENREGKTIGASHYYNTDES